MADMIRIAGKTDNNTASPFHLTENGNLCTQHNWEYEISNIVTATPTDTTEVRVGVGEENAIFVAGYGLISLRITNNTGVPVHIRFMADHTYDATGFLADVDGNRIEFDVPSSSTNFIIITPEDIPALNYLRLLKFRYACKETPTNTTGDTFKVALARKR